MVTAFYAALLGIFFTVLTLRVLALRGVTPLKWLAFNNFGAQAFERSVRAHGNFIEYVPMVLLMMYLQKRPSCHRCGFISQVACFCWGVSCTGSALAL